MWARISKIAWSLLSLIVDALIGQGLDSGRVSIFAPAKQTARDQRVGAR